MLEYENRELNSKTILETTIETDYGWNKAFKLSWAWVGGMETLDYRKFNHIDGLKLVGTIRDKNFTAARKLNRRKLLKLRMDSHQTNSHFQLSDSLRFLFRFVILFNFAIYGNKHF